MACWYEWRTGELRFNLTPSRNKKGDWQRCGAKAKSTGKPCRARALENGRCKYHGGLSTGQKTIEGKIKALMNLKQYKNLIPSEARTLIQALIMKTKVLQTDKAVKPLMDFKTAFKQLNDHDLWPKEN